MLRALPDALLTAHAHQQCDFECSALCTYGRTYGLTEKEINRAASEASGPYHARVRRIPPLWSEK